MRTSEWLRRSSAGLLAAAMVLTGGVGCGAAGSDGPPSPDAVAWVDSVCGSLAAFTQAAAAPPDIDPEDPVRAVENLHGYIGATGPTLEAALTDLGAVGTAPVEGGDALVTQLIDRLGSYRDGFAAAQAALEVPAAADPANADTVLPAALEPLRELSALPAPTVELDPATPLGRAAAEASRCRSIRTGQS